MDAEELKSLQAPLKERYREVPEAARITLQASGQLDSENIACKVATARAVVDAGLHPSTGGDGHAVCSGDMLLEALVACAGVTLRAVATALEIPLRGGTVRAEGDLDFRGTLGVDRDAAVGFSGVRLHFDLDTDAPPQQIEKLVELTERYCVVYQTLRNSPQLELQTHRLAAGRDQSPADAKRCAADPAAPHGP
ncbi:MAG: OsmC family protein [Gammaproteobacteria bacterium]|nr:OsmC family protein [Gammaproteobacteria bacterium]